MLGSKSGIHAWLVALYSYIPSATIFKYLGFFTLVLNIRLFFHIHISEIKEGYNTNQKDKTLNQRIYWVPSLKNLPWFLII